MRWLSYRTLRLAWYGRNIYRNYIDDEREEHVGILFMVLEPFIPFQSIDKVYIPQNNQYKSNYEPGHSISKKIACTLSEDSNQPGHSCFVCVEILRPSQPNRVMSCAVSLPNHTFTMQA